MVYDLVILGGGPAGLATAAEACKAGISNLLVLEKKASEHSYSIRKYYSPGKHVDRDYKGTHDGCEGVLCFRDTDREHFLEIMNGFIDTFEIPIQYETTIEKIRRQKDIFILQGGAETSFKARAVVVAIGVMGKPNRPSYPIPTNLRSKISYRVDTKDFTPGQKILVVGGGNSAAEYAQFLSAFTQITLSYRQKAFHRLNAVNLQIIDKLNAQGKLRLLLESDIDSIEPHKNQIKVNFKSQPSEYYNRIVYALGGTAPKEFLKSIGIQFDGKEPQVNDQGETNIPGLYLAGDLVAQGKGSIIRAFNSAHRIITQGICKNKSLGDMCEEND